MNNKKILITGAGGFVGSHLAELCVTEGFDVKGFIHYNSNNHWGWLENSKKKKEIEIISGDVRDFDSVYNAMKDCDTVFHLAALIGIPYSYVSPLAYIRTNIEGTYNILQSAKELNLCNVIITSTSETYGTARYVPIDENHPYVGQSPYSATKIAADQLAISFFRSFNTPVKIVRPFNVYGPRQSARAIIPTIIAQIMKNQKFIKLGNLNPTRDFTYVKDTAKGFLEVAKSDKLFGEVTNVGMNKEINMENLVKLISKCMDIKINILSENIRKRKETSEVERLKCDNTKIKKYTNWQPEYNINKGLIKTIEWMKENIKLYKNEIYNI